MNVERWQHPHSFGQDRIRKAERRTYIVIAVTATMMAVEIAAGLVFSSMALLADGLHMASHAAALSITAFAYVYVRRHARDARLSFGTGKANALGGFSGAILLAVFALFMAGQSIDRLANPVPIAFDKAILVAVVGLVVNGASMLILGPGAHDHDEDAHAHKGAHHARADHNLRSAYLHVLADALTSVLAIVALLTAKYLGTTWMDPLMGLIGAVLVARWSLGLLRQTTTVLLDWQAPEEIRAAIQGSIEQNDGDRVADLHVWSVGPAVYAAIVCVVSGRPRTADWYRAALPAGLGLVHVTVEVNCCIDPPVQVTEKAKGW